MQNQRLIWLIGFLVFSLGFLPVLAQAKPERGKANPPGRAGGPGAGPRFQNANPPGAIGGPGAGNIPGPQGGPGAGPRWTNNSNRIDNPPGPIGGQGTDFGSNTAESLNGDGRRVDPEFQKRADFNGDGIVDQFERRRMRQEMMQKMGNPPGPLGGQGTDWLNNSENSGNPPGPMGGPGAGPRWTDNPNKIDNPPGPIGGQGTDFGNRFGQQGKQGFGNPPGPQGEPGRGNPPGPQGGPGAGRKPN